MKQVQEEAIRALSSVQKSGHRNVNLELISMALHGKKINFDKVISMIDDMVVLLGKEQVADDEKKAYCEAEIDKAVAEATEQRKEDHEDFVENMAADNAAKDLIGFAKNRMQKFYNPKLYKAPPKRELSEEERITFNMGGTLAPTNAPGGIAGTGVALDQEAPPPPPEAVPAYQKKGQESSGVMAMMDMMVADLDKEIQEMEFEEKDAQAEYEEFVKVSAEKRAADAKSIQEKEAAKAGLEASIVDMETEHKATMKQAMAKGEYLSDLHGDCDWLLQNFEYRKEARAGEVEALKKAKAVLSGADYSLVQVTRKHLRATHRHGNP